jgi:hypothetical protein
MFRKNLLPPSSPSYLEGGERWFTGNIWIYQTKRHDTPTYKIPRKATISDSICVIRRSKYCSSAGQIILSGGEDELLGADGLLPHFSILACLLVSLAERRRTSNPAVSVQEWGHRNGERRNGGWTEWATIDENFCPAPLQHTMWIQLRFNKREL